MPRDLTLCLSGGGFRATLFHLGVIRALRDLELLQSVREIFSVSGGSIVAAHVVLNWERYTATNDVQFQAAALELVRFTQQDLRGKILRRAVLLGWIAPLHFGRTAQLARRYGKLFDNLLLESLQANGRPELRILATNLVSGELNFFDARGIHKIDAKGKVEEVAAAADLPVGVAVAASSAFPPFFPPVSLVARKLGVKGGSMRGVERFTDGGVFDNTGVRAALATTAADRMLLVSDASAGFDQATDQRFAGIISRTIRTSDVLMSRVAALENDHLQLIERDHVICRISDRISAADLPGINVPSGLTTQSPAVQKWIANVRTDLDRFPIELIRPIFRHGYEVGLRFGPRLSQRGTQFLIHHPAWSPGDTQSPSTARFRATVARLERSLEHAMSGVAENDAVRTDRSVVRALERGARRSIGWSTAGLFCGGVVVVMLIAAKFFYWDQRARPPELTALWSAVDAGSMQSDSLRRQIDDAGLWPINQRLTTEAYTFLKQKNLPGSVALFLVRSPSFAHPTSQFDACLRSGTTDVRLFPYAVLFSAGVAGFTRPAQIEATSDGSLKLHVAAAAAHSHVVLIVAAAPAKPGADPLQALDQLQSWRVCDDNSK